MSSLKQSDLEREKAKLKARLTALEALPEGEDLPEPVGPDYAPDSPIRALPTIEAMLAERYADVAVRETIRKEIVLHGTETAIIRGELVLPSPEDAHRHHHGINEQEYQKELLRRR